MLGRRYVALAGALLAPALPALASLGACSSDTLAGGPSTDAQAEASSAEDAVVAPGEDAPPVVFGDDVNAAAPDATPQAACPGSSVPEDATSTACAIDTSGSCPACASWGFVCPSWARPQMQDASAASFCNATEFDGGALICCTEPACVVSTAAGECDASSQTRYDCSGGAVPHGACTWLGAASPNDYCCQ
jgi:hypothetical protein